MGMVTGVDAEGLIADWNYANDIHKVRVDDRVISVNGVGGSFAGMREELKSAHELEMVVQSTQAGQGSQRQRNEEREQEERAATLVQSIYRAGDARQELQELQRHSEEAH